MPKVKYSPRGNKQKKYTAKKTTPDNDPLAYGQGNHKEMKSSLTVTVKWDRTYCSRTANPFNPREGESLPRRHQKSDEKQKSEAIKNRRM